MSALCRDCLADLAEVPAHRRCGSCGSPRLIDHSELNSLAIAHIDCGAFYATIEKRDDPEIRDRPVIVGGGHRGVVSAACYMARVYGIGSAMPMFKALKACPDAVVIRPNMSKYQAVGRQVRELMQEITPLVEPLSIDEAFLDLSGTEALHRASPAKSLASLVRRIEDQIGVTASVGLSYNKFLAKVASDLDKPRGFAVIGRADARDFLRDQPASLIWGVGKALRRTLERDGIKRIADLWSHDEAALERRYGAMGRRLYRFSRGRDDRPVDPSAPTKSISAETTFNQDLEAHDELAARLWPLCETVARRLRRANLAGRSVVLKLKTDRFQLLTRSRRLADPTQLAETIYRVGEPLLKTEADGRRFRLIGIGVSDLAEGALADPPSLFDQAGEHRAEVERAIEAVREKLGKDAIGKGRSLTSGRPNP